MKIRVQDRFQMVDEAGFDDICRLCGEPLDVRINVSTPWCTDERGVTAYDVIGAPDSTPKGETTGLCEPCANDQAEKLEREAKARSRAFGIDLALMARKEGAS